MSITVALDIGGVCVQLRNEECARAFGASSLAGIPPEVLGLFRSYSTGVVSTEEWLAAMERFFSGKMSRPEIIDAWNVILGEPVPGMCDAVREFAVQGVKFVFLSDTNETHMNYIYNHVPLCRWVSDAVLSYETGACKPDSPMYAEFEKRHGLPDFYFDDLPQNIAAAEERKWNAVRFRSAVQFRNILSDCLSNHFQK